MKLLGFVWLTCWIAMTLWAASAADTYSARVTGDDYSKMPTEQRTAYIMAAYDMMERMAAELDDAGAKAFIERAHRCTVDKTGDELREYIDEYMSRDAKYGEYAMASNYRAALHEKCPQ